MAVEEHGSNQQRLPAHRENSRGWAAQTSSSREEEGLLSTSRSAISFGEGPGDDDSAPNATAQCVCRIMGASLFIVVVFAMAGFLQVVGQASAGDRAPSGRTSESTLTRRKDGSLVANIHSPNSAGMPTARQGHSAGDLVGDDVWGKQLHTEDRGEAKLDRGNDRQGAVRSGAEHLFSSVAQEIEESARKRHSQSLMLAPAPPPPPVLPAVSQEAIDKALQKQKAEADALAAGYGSPLGAFLALKKALHDEPEADKDCKLPRFEVLEKCVCPPGSKWNGDSCGEKTNSMTFYMYRAQGDSDYPLSNVNMADLVGVMYYLHNEVVMNNDTPSLRFNGITRIIRSLVTVQPSTEMASRGMTFMPFVAFDSGRCSVPGCDALWGTYGFAVGCQVQEGAGYAYRASKESGLAAGAWFSLPGACPAEGVGEKDGACLATYPGGSCSKLSNSEECTYSVHFAGELFLDELDHIEDFAKWQTSGHREYDVNTDRGVGTSFWNFKDSAAWCDRRMNAVRRMFKRRYPMLPDDLPRPACD